MHVIQHQDNAVVLGLKVPKTFKVIQRQSLNHKPKWTRHWVTGLRALVEGTRLQG